MKRLLIDFTCDWIDLFKINKPFNFLDFTFIFFRIEDDRAFGMFKIDIGLLGFILHASWIYNPNTQMRKYVVTSLENLLNEENLIGKKENTNSTGNEEKEN